MHVSGCFWLIVLTIPFCDGDEDDAFSLLFLIGCHAEGLSQLFFLLCMDLVPGRPKQGLFFSFSFRLHLGPFLRNPLLHAAPAALGVNIICSLSCGFCVH